MLEYAIARLVADDHHGIRRMARGMVESWPGETALGTAFAITSAASLFEDSIDASDSKGSTQLGYQMAALVAADIYADNSMDQCPAKGQDLLHFWRRVDQYFPTD